MPEFIGTPELLEESQAPRMKILSGRVEAFLIISETSRVRK
jgi:hypothetical protein